MLLPEIKFEKTKQTPLKNLEVTVIIPFFNRSKYLPELMNGLRSQTHKNWRAIFVDDCSEEQEFQQLKAIESSQCVIYRFDKNQGPAAARNFAIQRCNTDYVIFHDSDDISKPKRFETLLEFMEDNPKIWVAGSRLAPFGDAVHPDINILKFWPNLTTPEDIRESYNNLNHAVCAPSAIYRRKLFEYVGYFTPLLRYSEDVDFFIRASRLGFEIANLKKRLYRYRCHGQNSKLTCNYKQYVKLLIKMYRKL